jgi:hypothetical protein
MRTTLNIPEDLLEEARQATGFQSKTDIVILSLQELVRRRRIEELKGLFGRLALDVDTNTSRRRPKRKAK